MEHKIVTLITDWGTRDYFAAAFKGMLFSKLPGINVVDISHDVQLGDVLRASYILRNAYTAFPAGSIHVIGVDAERSKEEDLEEDLPRRILLIENAGHYFIGADSGIFGLIFDSTNQEIIELASYDNMNRAQLFELIIDTCYKIASGENIITMGRQVEKMKELYSFQSYLSENGIMGKIIYMDSAGNLITNINYRLFESIKLNRTFQIYLRKDLVITEISKWYDEVPKGEALLMVNHAGFLEIAMNGSNAHKMLAIKEGDQVRITFNP